MSDPPDDADREGDSPTPEAGGVAPVDSDGNPGDSERVPGDSERVPGDSERVPGDSERVPGDSERVPGDSERVPGDSDRDSGDPEDLELFGGDRVPEPVEPGSPTLENAVFVALGVASMIALVVHLFSLL